MPGLIQQRKAIVVENPGEAVIADVPMPLVSSHQALVKTTAVAINPIDHICIDNYSSSGTIVGCDYAGVVMQVGDDVELDVRPGDRVAGFVHGCKTNSSDVFSQLFNDKPSAALSHEIGAFSEYTLATGNIMLKIPDHISDEDAAGLGTGIAAAGMALYQNLKFPTPDQPSRRATPLLIFGGSTSTGAIAIQLAKLSGLRVITTCSPHNFDYVRSLGADDVFDYRSPTCAKDIRRASPMLSYVFDCVANEKSKRICSEAICLSGGDYVPILPSNEFPRRDVRIINVAIYKAFGEQFSLGHFTCPATPEMFCWCSQWFKLASKLLAQGRLRPHRTIVRDGGLEAVLDQGLSELRQGKISGHKLIYKM